MNLSYLFFLVFPILGIILPFLDRAPSSSPRYMSTNFLLFIVALALTVIAGTKISDLEILQAGGIILVTFIAGALGSMYWLGDFKKPD
jgi:quinol-cytochrome oxidoreductase complex cytochrome b subunit